MIGSIPLRLPAVKLGAGLLGLALLVSLPTANGIAQKVAALGYLTNASADPKRIEDVRHALADLGYVEGKNITIEILGARSNEDYDAMAAELVARPVDIIIAVNSAATNAARKATSTIPIVMTAVNDPVEWGFVRSLERPGTNVTGTTLNAPQLVGERLRILNRIVHNLDQISMLIVASNAANRPLFARLTSEAQAMGIKAQVLEVRFPQDIAPAFDKALSWGAKALVHANDAFINAQRVKIAKLAAQNHLPVMYADREYVVAGGLMSLGPGHRQGDVGAAKYIDMILHGANPAELPVAVPTDFTFSVSRSALDQLGLPLPDDVKAKVNEWID
jgi:putative tryptophan/tyrosine transport system substrate-binding protein